MYLYQVGQLYHPNRTSWPEGTEYAYRGGNHVLHLFLRDISPQELADVKSGACEFALVVKQDVLFLLYQIGEAFQWSDAPYSWYMERVEDRQEPPVLQGDERVGLTLFLVEARTGILQALRFVTFSHEFSVELHTAIRSQMERPFDQVTYDRQLRSMQYAYPKSADMLVLARTRCKGGEEL